jgi:hypothetical protein
MSEESLIAVSQETPTETESVAETSETEVETTETQSPTDQQSEAEDLIFGKYKDIDAAQSAFKTLESENGRLRREKQPTAPDEYSFDFSEDEDLKDIYSDYDFAEDPVLKDMLPVFKDANITEDQAKSIVRGFGLHQKSNMVDFDSEVAKIEGGLETVSAVENYVQKNFTTSEQEVVASWLTTAEGLSVFKKMTMDKPNSIPTSNANVSSDSSADLISKAMELKKSNDLISNTTARDAYEKLMNKAVEMQMKGL